MLRALPVIVAALELVAPKFQHKAEASVHLQALAVQHDLDPFTIIAVVRNESAWQSGAINRRTGARGLGQIMPSNYRKCVEAPNGPACERIKAALLGWKYNLSETARTMATWRRYCDRRVGSELAIHWLPGYQGLDMRRGAICGHQRRKSGWTALPSVPKLTQKVLANRRELMTRFAAPTKAKVKAKGKPKPSKLKTASQRVARK
jgi:Transglycosylase SLT domain